LAVNALDAVELPNLGHTKLFLPRLLQLIASIWTARAASCLKHHETINYWHANHSYLMLHKHSQTHVAFGAAKNEQKET
jgi:hypothetical protein